MTTRIQTFNGNIGIGTDDPGAYKLRVDGTVRANSLEINGVTNAQVPSGLIIIWSGTRASIPTGWVLCDGTNSTPNLVGRFIRGASGDAPSPVAVNTTGGANTVTLSTANLASHTHSGNSADQSANHTHTASTGTQSANHTHTATVGNQSVNHTHTLTTGNNSVNHTHPTGNNSVTHTHPGTTGNNNVPHTHGSTTGGNNSPQHVHKMDYIRLNLNRNWAGNPGPAPLGNAVYWSPQNRPTTSISSNHTHTLTTGNQSANHTHTITTGNNSASHSHPFGNQRANHTHPGTSLKQSASHSHSVTNGNQSDSHSHSVTNGNQSASHNHAVTIGNEGSGTAVTITNPYYVLAYIMKT